MQAGLALAVEFWLPELRDPEYGRRLRILQSRLAAAPEHPYTILMLGSSRTFNGYKGNLVEAEFERRLHRPVMAFNFGITGAGPLVQMLTFRRLLALGVRPDLVLVEVFPALYDREHSAGELARLSLDRVWPEDLPALARYGGITADSFHRWWWDALLPVSRYRFPIVMQLAPAFIPYERRIDWIFYLDQTGCVTVARKRVPDNLREQATERSRKDYEPTLARLHPGGISCQAVADLLTLCREKRIATALVVMPEGPTFRSWYSRQAWPEFQEYLGRLSRDWGSPIVDARDWIGEDGFADSQHLLSEGAFVFTKRLAVEALASLAKESLAARHGATP